MSKGQLPTDDEAACVASARASVGMSGPLGEHQPSTIERWTFVDGDASEEGTPLVDNVGVPSLVGDDNPCWDRWNHDADFYYNPKLVEYGLEVHDDCEYCY